jgi:isopentenyl-diphosphate delta-isomerase
MQDTTSRSRTAAPLAPIATTEERKQSHVEICLNGAVRFRTKTNGFEAYRFTHNAVPEINYADISLATTFLGRKISSPIMISSMTGGYKGAEAANHIFAEACQNLNIPLGIGSMRQALENSAQHKSFSVVRQIAPDIPIYANIGAPEVAEKIPIKNISLLLGLIKADALIIHLNPAQELFQPEGKTAFAGVLKEIKRLSRSLDVPLIAKEVGSGISGEAAERLIEAGVQVIDVAGAGGTSWMRVEEERYKKQFITDDRFTAGGLAELLDWGIPTANCVAELGRMKHKKKFGRLSVIASGGIVTGVEMAKALALGANVCAAAKPMLKAAFAENGAANVAKLIGQWQNELKAVMFLIGAKTISDLHRTKCICKTQI